MMIFGGENDDVLWWCGDGVGKELVLAHERSCNTHTHTQARWCDVEWTRTKKE